VALLTSCRTCYVSKLQEAAETWLRRPREKTPDNCPRESLNNVNNDDDDAFKIYADILALIKNMALSNPIS